MKLNAPKQLTWWISVILLIVGVIASLINVPVLTGLGLWIVVIGHVLLLVATLISNL
ncbi:MAG: hypothetical protein JXA09_18270 [Anaerolineae bacterium]|nr:hypothetical protein [Anaerolineae bacterium]